MADSSPDPAIPPRPGTPRWVKVIGVVFLGVVLLALAVMVLGGGQHGPGMHTGTGAIPSLSSTASDPSSHDRAVTPGRVTLG
jgi:hypothetical protein